MAVRRERCQGQKEHWKTGKVCSCLFRVELINIQELRNLDPFLLLDEFEGNSKDGAGFPDHPHRGFETVSYILEGEFTHEDFAGENFSLRNGTIPNHLPLIEDK